MNDADLMHFQRRIAAVKKFDLGHFDTPVLTVKTNDRSCWDKQMPFKFVRSEDIGICHIVSCFDINFNTVKLKIAKINFAEKPLT